MWCGTSTTRTLCLAPWLDLDLFGGVFRQRKERRGAQRKISEADSCLLGYHQLLTSQARTFCWRFRILSLWAGWSQNPVFSLIFSLETSVWTHKDKVSRALGWDIQVLNPCRGTGVGGRNFGEGTPLPLFLLLYCLWVELSISFLFLLYFSALITTLRRTTRATEANKNWEQFPQARSCLILEMKHCQGMWGGHVDWRPPFDLGGTPSNDWLSTGLVLSPQPLPFPATATNRRSCISSRSQSLSWFRKENLRECQADNPGGGSQACYMLAPNYIPSNEYHSPSTTEGSPPQSPPVLLDVIP